MSAFPKQQKRKRPIAPTLVWARESGHEGALEHPAYLLDADVDKNTALIEWTSNGSVQKIPKDLISLGLAPRRPCRPDYSQPYVNTSSVQKSSRPKSKKVSEMIPQREDRVETKQAAFSLNGSAKRECPIASPSPVASSMQMSDTPSTNCETDCETIQLDSVVSVHTISSHGIYQDMYAYDTDEDRSPVKREYHMKEEDLSHGVSNESYTGKIHGDEVGTAGAKRKHSNLAVRNPGPATVSSPSKRVKIKLEPRDDPLSEEDGTEYNGKTEQECLEINHQHVGYSLGKTSTYSKAAMLFKREDMESESASGASTGRSSLPKGKVKPDKWGIHVVAPADVPKPASDTAWSKEVLKRAKATSNSMVLEYMNNQEPTLEIVRNENCHICHKRKKLGLTFHCGKHTYCDMHCASRLSFRVKDYDSENPTCLPIDYCPVCTLHCTCAKCKRRLEAVAGMLEKECEEQGSEVETVVMENLYHLCSAKNPGKFERDSLVKVGGSGSSKKKGSSEKVKIGDNAKISLGYCFILGAAALFALRFISAMNLGF